MSHAAKLVGLLKYSFCGKSQCRVRKLITGPGAYIYDKYIGLCNEITTGGLESENSPSLELLPTPHKIFDSLQMYVIDQESAKRTLSAAVYNHYKRVRAMRYGESSGMEIIKSNTLLLGPTGTGKIHLVRSLTRLLKVPFCIVDATALTEVRYMGEDVENILLCLIQAADGDMKEAERGIVYIDETDKTSRKGENASTTRDVSDEGVQKTLLKIIKSTMASVSPQGRRKRPYQDFTEVDTSSILSIAAGAFAGIDETVKAHPRQRSTGLGSDLRPMKEHGDLYAKATPDDSHKFGLIPEFTGRLPVIINVSTLNVDDSLRMLAEPKDATSKQYQHLFELDGIKLAFTDEAIRKVARVAEKRDIGACSLSTLIEQVLAVIMLGLPSHDDVAEVIIESEYVPTGVGSTLVPREVGTLQAKSA